MSVTRVKGKVSKFSIGKKTFSVFVLSNRKVIPCFHQFKYLPLMEGDSISVLGEYDGKALTVTQYPLVAPGEDNETMVKYITKGTRGIICGGRAFNVYKSIDETQSFMEYMCEVSYLYQITKDPNVGGLLNMGFSERISLLSWWHNKVNLRKLYLFGLTKGDLNKIDLDPTEIYRRCMEDPFTVVEIPIEKCKRILRQTSNKLTGDQVTRGLIARSVYKHGFNDGWCGTPMATLRREYTNIDTHLEELGKDYQATLDMNTLYLPKQYRAETIVAKAFNRRVKWERAVEREPEYKLDSLTDKQKEAIRSALELGICIITGAAGTGKSTVINEISRNLDNLDKHHAIASFTGKAVARLKEVTGKLSPSTLDRMIVKKGEFGRFAHLIIDESSMVTTELMGRVLVAFDHRFRITLVGDPNQLEPIGWGSMFSQAIKSDTIKVVELDINHRSKNDGITANSTAVISAPFGSNFIFSSSGNFFVQEGDLSHIKSVLMGMKAKGYPIEKITTITPYNKCIKSINDIHRECIGVPPEELDQWAEGDRVMMTENNYDINVMNGEEGIIAECHQDYITVAFKNGEEHEFLIRKKGRKYRYNDVTDSLLIHAFCITVHRAQGSEWELVIVFIPGGPANANFLTRNLVYTAITRAKKAVWLIGKIVDFNKGASKKSAYRHDNLWKRLEGRDSDREG